MLGHPPVRNVMVELLILAGGSIGIVLLCLSISPVPAFIMGTLLIVVWMFLIAPRYLGNLISAVLHRKQYAQAKHAITQGQIGIGLVGRNRLCQGIVIADEQRRLTFINGRIVGFGDIASITVQTRRSSIYPFQDVWLDIMLRDAARTNLRVFFDDVVRADVFYRRLSSLLNFPS